MKYFIVHHRISRKEVSRIELISMIGEENVKHVENETATVKIGDLIFVEIGK